MFRFLKIIKTKIIIRWKYRSGFQLFKETIKIGEEILKDKKIVWNESNNFSKIIIIFLAQNLQRMRSIKTLCKEGLGQDAVVLLRVMFESLVDFKYIYLDKKKAKDYFDYGYYKQLKLGRILRRSNSKKINKSEIIKREKEVELNWNRVKNNFTTKKGTIFQRWSCKNLREMSKELNLEESYDYLYSYLSNYIHPSSLIAGEYVLGKDKKGVVVEIGTSKSLIHKVLPTANILFIEMLKIIDKEYNIGFDSLLEKWVNKLKKIIYS